MKFDIKTNPIFGPFAINGPLICLNLRVLLYSISLINFRLLYCVGISLNKIVTFSVRTIQIDFLKMISYNIGKGYILHVIDSLNM